MRISIPEEKKLVHEMIMPIRWGDMDAMGHINNVSYFRYLETCRIDWMSKQNMPANPHGDGMVIVNAFCNFYKELVYPGNISMKMYVSNIGEKTCDTWCTLEREDQPGSIYAAGGATLIWVDFLQKKAKSFPVEVVKLLKAN